jgi:hypothetical protein
MGLFFVSNLIFTGQPNRRKTGMTQGMQIVLGFLKVAWLSWATFVEKTRKRYIKKLIKKLKWNEKLNKRLKNCKRLQNYR